MAKTIYITEKQKKKLKKAIAAQDQVGGKVNADIMDGVVGLGEGKLNESPDSTVAGNFYTDDDAITFLLLLKNNKFYTDKGTTHYGIIKELITNGVIEDFDYEAEDFNDVVNPYLTGRYWEDNNIISFWSTPFQKNDRHYLRETLSLLQEHGVSLNPNTLIVDLWDTSNTTFGDSTVPYKWFFNGMFDSIAPTMNCCFAKPSEEIVKVQTQSSGDKYITYSGEVLTPMEYYMRAANSSVYENVESDSYELAPEKGDISPYYHVNETKKTVKNDKGEIVPEKCDKCGGKVVVQIHGEPVYVCKDCGKYFGTMPFTLKESKLNESWEDLQDIYEDHGCYDLLSEFDYDIKHNIKQKKWNLIPAQQYHTLLQRFMENPTMARIPYNVVHSWFFDIIVPNAIDIENITNLAGHSAYFPVDDVSDYFDAEEVVDYESGFEYLESLGFYDWCKLPDGSDGWSDYGLQPLFKNINSYTPNASAEDILILINRCLDVVHQRGDLSSAFIEGGKYSCDYISGNIKENIEKEIVNPEDVDLSSFNIKKKLNPKFWQDGHLDSRIRLKLLDIADDFIDFIDVDWVKPKDIIMTGSLANFNWDGRYSDIDLHILMDYSDVDDNVDLVKNYFLAKKTQWNDEHKDITIFGFPVELYVQDTNEKHSSSGVYSLDRDTWIVEPERDVLATSKVNKKYIRDKVSEYMNQIDKLVYLYKKNKKSEYKLSKISEKSQRLWDEIKTMRKTGFEKSGGKELSNENVIFKSLRRNGYLNKLYKLKTKSYDILSSL